MLQYASATGCWLSGCDWSRKLVSSAVPVLERDTKSCSSVAAKYPKDGITIEFLHLYVEHSRLVVFTATNNFQDYLPEINSLQLPVAR